MSQTIHADGTTTTEPALSDRQLDKRRIEFASDALSLAKASADTAAAQARVIRTALQIDGTAKDQIASTLQVLDQIAGVAGLLDRAGDYLSDIGCA